jgi:dolichyl-phosphate beta-glucosyltransferase
MTPPHLSIVIPAFNEAGRIEHTLRTLVADLPGIDASWEVLVVDDGSADDTREKVRRVAAGETRVRLLAAPHRGKGGAIRVGLLAARGAVRFMCDADLSMPVRELPRFLAVVPAQCDIAIGSREGAGARRVGEPGHRHLMGRLFNGLVRVSGLSGISDTQCGFKLFTAEAVDAIVPWLTLDGWAFDIEMLVIAKLRGLRVQALPIEWHYRELSRISPVADALRMSRDVVKIRLNALRGVYVRPLENAAAPARRHSGV